VNRTDAEDLVLVLSAAWPAMGLYDEAGEMTVRGAMYASDMMEAATEDGAAAVAKVRDTITSDFGPNAAVLKAAIGEARRDRVRALPVPPSADGFSVPPVRGPFIAFAEWFQHATAEQQEQARRCLPGAMLERAGVER